MKNLLISSLLLAGAVGARSQIDPSITTNFVYSIVENGPHSRVWQRTAIDSGPPDNAAPPNRPHRCLYVELATGLNRYDSASNQWIEASDQITVTPTGAAATNAQHQVVFLGNLNTAGAVQLTTPDSKSLRSNILGLGYFDAASGQSVVFAEILPVFLHQNQPIHLRHQRH